jgi:ABC-type transport system substrate-binding protein
VEWVRRNALATSLTVLALLAAACTSAPGGHDSTLTQPSNPVFSHVATAVVAVPSLPTNFNPSSPAGGNRITQEVMEQVWPQTFVTNSAGDQTLEPGFVESAEAVSVSPLTIAYTLNPAARWSDGVPITAADFTYNWREQLVYSSLLPDAGLVAGYRDISRITSSQHGHTVTVAFSRPFAEWESLFSNLVPAHIGERYGWVAAFQGFDRARVISGGPFEITRVVPGRELVLSRNPSYWAAKPSMKQIVLKVMQTSSALAGLDSGAVSVTEAPAGPQDTNVLASAARTGRALSREDTTLPTLWQLCLNMTSPTLQPEAFRLGIEDALYIAQIAADSVGLEDETLGPSFDRFAPAAEAASGEQHTEPWSPAGALGYLTSLGLVSGSDGYLRLGGVDPPVTLTLLIPGAYPTILQAADVIQSELQAVGVRTVIREEPLSTMLVKTMPSGGYELAIAPFLLTPFPVGEALVYSVPVLPASVSPPGSATSAGGGSPAAAGLPATSSTGRSGGAGAGASSRSSTSTTTTTIPPASNPALPWSAPTPAGTEPGADVAGVVTRDVFGLDDPLVSRFLEEALTNLNTNQAAAHLGDADTTLWQDVPTIPLFQQPVEVIHQSNLINVSESPTWAGIFWDAEQWAVQVAPPISPPTFPGVTPPSPASAVTGGAPVANRGVSAAARIGTKQSFGARVSDR